MSLARTVLSEQIREILLNRILGGEYSPGEQLVETQLAREFGTSQAPVREALTELEFLRFVESQPHKSTRVREVTPQELTEIYPVRAALEEVAARAAAENLDGEVGELEEEFDAMIDAADAGDLHRQVSHDVAFHHRIVEASGNQTLFEVWRSLRVEARTVITVLKTDIDLYELAEMHRPLLEALAEGDPEGAGTALRKHFELFNEMMLEGVREE